MMTSNNDRHVEAKALNAGADDFISKPVNKIDIEAKLTLGWRLIRTQLELLVVNQRLSERYSLWLPKKYQLRGRPHKDPEKRRFSGT
jgi:PleD family two-component response regulator